MTFGSYGFKSHPRHFFTCIQTDIAVPYFLIIFLLSSTLLFGELDLGFEPQPVTIKGEGLSAQEVLEQVESQLDIQIELKESFNDKNLLLLGLEFDEIISFEKMKEIESSYSSHAQPYIFCFLQKKYRTMSHKQKPFLLAE